MILAGGQVVGTFDYGPAYPMVAFAADGKTLDATFGNGGVVNVPNSNLFIPNIFVDDQNRVLVPTTTMGYLESVLRYTANGALDPSFGTAGKATLSIPSDLSLGTTGALAARVQSGGRIVLLSYAYSSNSQNVVVLSRLWN